MPLNSCCLSLPRGAMSAVLMSLGLCAMPASASLVTNGTFDTGITGWTAAGNDGNGGFRATGGNTGGTPDGFFILNAAGAAGSDPSISQLLTGLVVGQTYTVAGDFTNRYNCCGAPGNPTLSFGVDIIPGGLLTELANPGAAYPTWHGFTTSFVATQAQHTIVFTGERNGTDVDYAIDNISVIGAVPEPASLALVGLALAGLGAARRLRH